VHGLVNSLAVAIAVGIATLYSVEAVRYCLEIWRWLPAEERRERRGKGLCAGCGYDLTGNASGVCPECGGNIRQEVDDRVATFVPSLILREQPWWVWALVVTMMIAVVIVRQFRL
jgi:hypothetical protein